MQITVVIPTLNRPDLLKQCLQALSEQSLEKDEFEVVVVNDGPEEKGNPAINEYHQQLNLRFFALPEKKGPAAARNFGWQMAASPLIAFTDDDCLPHEFWLEEILRCFHQKDVKAISGMTIVPRSSSPTDYELNTAGLEDGSFITANCACTRDALKSAGGFDEEFCTAWREDSDLEFKLMEKGIVIQKLMSAVVIHLVREAVWGVSIYEQKKTLFNALLFRKHPYLYRERVQQSPPYLYYAIIGYFIFLITGIVFSSKLIFLIGFACWMILTLFFTYKRLKRTSHSPGHILEMCVTSALIPFLSIFWQWYGAVKFRVLFF